MRAVASVFMLQPQPERTWRQIVVDGLQGREVLLVIDNCEHVLDEIATLVEASRRVLDSAGVGDQPRVVGGRVASGRGGCRHSTGAAAVELFIERADAAASGFHPDDADLVGDR